MRSVHAKYINIIVVFWPCSPGPKCCREPSLQVRIIVCVCFISSSPLVSFRNNGLYPVNNIITHLSTHGKQHTVNLPLIANSLNLQPVRPWCIHVVFIQYPGLIYKKHKLLYTINCNRHCSK